MLSLHVYVWLGADRHVIMLSLRKCFTLLPFASGMETGSNQGCVFLIDGAITWHKILYFHWTIANKQSWIHTWLVTRDWVSEAVSHRTAVVTKSPEIREVLYQRVSAKWRLCGSALVYAVHKQTVSQTYSFSISGLHFFPHSGGGKYIEIHNEMFKVFLFPQYNSSIWVNCCQLHELQMK